MQSISDGCRSLAQDEVSRFSLADLPEWGDWLVKRIRERWPGVGDAGWLSKLRGWEAMNEVLLLKCGGCIGMAVAVRDDMNGRLRVEERFTFARVRPRPPEERKKGDPNTPAEDEMALIYHRMFDWARSQQADLFVLGTHSDMHRDRLVPLFGEAITVERRRVVRLK